MCAALCCGLGLGVRCVSPCDGAGRPESLEGWRVGSRWQNPGSNVGLEFWGLHCCVAASAGGEGLALGFQVSRGLPCVCVCVCVSRPVSFPLPHCHYCLCVLIFPERGGNSDCSGECNLKSPCPPPCPPWPLLITCRDLPTQVSGTWACVHTSPQEHSSSRLFIVKP